MIKFFLYFCLSFLLLSIPVEKKQLFYHLDQLTISYTRPLFEKTKNFMAKQMKNTTILGINLFPSSKKKQLEKELKPKLTTQTPNLPKFPVNQKYKPPKSEDQGEENYSESELLKLKTMLKNSDI